MKTMKGVITSTTLKGADIPIVSDLFVEPWEFILTTVPYQVGIEETYTADFSEISGKLPYMPKEVESYIGGTFESITGSLRELNVYLSIEPDTTTTSDFESITGELISLVKHYTTIEPDDTTTSDFDSITGNMKQVVVRYNMDHDIDKILGGQFDSITGTLE